MDLSFFNPRSQSEADFIASFVARKSMLDYFVRQLRQLDADEPARHQLIVAPRGYGKTSMLRRVAIAVRADPDLRARYLPLSFREEQHNVISLDVFWRNCIQSLLETREEEQASESELDDIDAAWKRLEPRQELPRTAQDGEPQRAELQQRCAALGRRPILLIDNLDTLLAGLVSDHQWTLRQTLQQGGGPVLLAAASRYPDCTHDPAAAFYEFFRIETLSPLDNAEVLSCLKSLAQQRGERGKSVLELLDRDPGRVAALNTLAGGNPRTLGVLYSVLESHMSTDVLSQLSAMLDTFTGWYQARTEELPMQARAVFDALALNWDPATAADLGKATGLEIGAISSQLSRLEKLGLVEAVPLTRKGKGRSGYQLIERFFNIWYLMRNGPRRARQSIKFLTVFLQSCFSAVERRELGKRILEAEYFDPDYALALASTLRRGPLPLRLLDRVQQISPSSDYHAAIREAKATLEPREDETDLGTRIQLMQTVINGRELQEQGRYDEALTVYNAVASMCNGTPRRREQRLGQNEPTLQELVARALAGRGDALENLGRYDEAFAAYNEIEQRFGKTAAPALREMVAWSLLFRGGILVKLGRHHDALTTYTEMDQRFGNIADPLYQKMVAWSLLLRGLRLETLGRHDEAIAVYNDVEQRFQQDTDPELQEQVANALVCAGRTLGKMGRIDEALAAYEAVYQRFAQSSDLKLKNSAAEALRLTSLTQTARGDIDAAETAIRQAMTLDPRNAIHLITLGNLLLDYRGDAKAAEQAYSQGLAHTSNDHHIAVLSANRAYVLALHLGRFDEAQACVAKVRALKQGRLSAAGDALLSALPKAPMTTGTDWTVMFQAVAVAVECGDPALWSDYLDKLQRLLWFVSANGASQTLRDWMQAADYPVKQAPLYHAVATMEEGEDHLLRINPEVRGPAQRIYAGVARMKSIFRGREQHR